MATLRYFNTFIDEEPSGNLLESRSKSWPQLGGTGHATEEIEEMETQAANHVAELQGKWSTFGERHPMSPKPQPNRSANKGSRGHPVVCRRPCIRFAKGDCEVGDACGYCHHQHPRYVTPNKSQRLKLDCMDPWFLSLCFLFVAAHWRSINVGCPPKISVTFHNCAIW